MNEREYCSYFLRVVRKRPDVFAYKIPDVPRTMRFIPPKPFDLDVRVGGRAFAIEAKFQKKLQAFGMRALESSQVQGLTDVHAVTPGCALVVLFAHVGRGDRRLYVWEWSHFASVPSRRQAVLIKAGNYVRVTEAGEGVRSLFDFVMPA